MKTKRYFQDFFFLHSSFFSSPHPSPFSPYPTPYTQHPTPRSLPISIYTLGCKLNQVESEAVAGSFRKAGFPLVQWGAVSEKPGLLIINTCTVTSKADQKARRVIRKALRDNPDACVIVTGCYAQLDYDEIATLETECAAAGAGAARPEFRRRLFVLQGGENTAAAKSALLALPRYLAESLKNQGTGAFLPHILEAWAANARGDSPFSFQPEELSFHSRGYLKIQDGCGNRCAYCRARLARGPCISLPPQEALNQLRAFEAAGCAEVMITGMNITQYRHGGCGLAGLLQCLLEGSETIALRLSSLEPDGIDEKLAAALARPRIRPHFHLSVQSGSDAVLAKMGRAYTAREAEERAALLRSVKGAPFLACDIIAGFPGETEADFAQTLALCERIGFAWIHAFPYSKRPGTAAFSFGSPVCERDATRRAAALTALALRGRRDYARAWLGKELSAVIENSTAGAVVENSTAGAVIENSTAGAVVEKSGIGDRGSGIGKCRAVAENYLKLIVNYTGDAPPPGSQVRCVLTTLCEDADGEKPDAVAEIR